MTTADDDTREKKKVAAIGKLLTLGEPAPLPRRPAPTFVITKQHRRFAEFCDTVRRERYIGLCHGAPGVGKTLSARHYCAWDEVGPIIDKFRFFDTKAPDAALAARAIYYTPRVSNTPRTVEKDVSWLHSRFSWAIDAALHPDQDGTIDASPTGPYTELAIIDEADRLKTAGLEALRDHHDRTGIGLILIGMPGIERRLARYPQLYSRVGFLHHYQPLTADEQTFVLAEHWPELQLNDTDDYTASEARAAIIRTTGGNFRLTTRLIAQIRRLMAINQIHTVTSEIVDAARESLIIGAT